MAPLASAELDVLAAAPELVIDQYEVLYLRSPWGNGAVESTGGAPIPSGPWFAVASPSPLEGVEALPPSAFELEGDEEPVKLHFWADEEASSLLGVATPLAGGGWPITTLLPVDVPQVFASAIDRAGNESATVGLRYQEWVATLREGSDGTSPHVLPQSPSASVALLPEAGSSTAQASGAGAMGGESATSEASPVWEELGPWDGGPGLREAHAMAYDAARGVVVLYGGSDPSGMRTETWEWDGRRWHQRGDGVPHPGGKHFGRMAWDARRGEIVHTGGHPPGGANAVNQTATWDGEAWLLVSESEASFESLAGHATTYDSARDLVLVHGGYKIFWDPQSKAKDKLWGWDGVQWTTLHEGSSPGGCLMCPMTFDPVREVAVLGPPRLRLRSRGRGDVGVGRRTVVGEGGAARHRADGGRARHHDLARWPRRGRGPGRRRQGDRSRCR